MLNMKKLFTKILTAFVNKTGDTMTGTLIYKSAGKTGASSNWYGRGLELQDEDGLMVGLVTATNRNGFGTGTSFEGVRVINGTYYYNTIRLELDASGNPVTEFGSAASIAAFGNALTLAMGNPTIQNGVKATITANTSCRIGKQVSINLVLNGATLAAGTANILTLPTGFRPKAQAFATLLIGGVYRNGRIDTTGLLTVYAGVAVSNAEIKVLSTFIAA